MLYAVIFKTKIKKESNRLNVVLYLKTCLGFNKMENIHLQ